MDNLAVWTESNMRYIKGHDYELWKDTGTTSMELKENGTFSCSWSDIHNALFRAGRKFFFVEKPIEEIKSIVVNYGVDYHPEGNSYLCIYGWLKDPLVEYYVVESWGDWRPPGAESKGQITVDGGTYDVYVTVRENEPSIEGTKTFTQYWSVRTEKQCSGTVSLNEHFKAWTKFGLEPGRLYETSLTVEGFQSKGSAEVYRNELVITTTQENPKYVAVTFDDGPNTTITPAILDVLEEFGEVGTFFLIGENITEASKEVMRRQVAMGCELQNHSFTHTPFTELSVEEMREEIRKTNALIREIAGAEPKYFRPPYIAVNDEVYENVDMPFVMGIMCNDWDDNMSATARTQMILDNVRDGSIVLIHDTYGNNLSVLTLRWVLKALKDEGYTLVTLSELFRIKGVDAASKKKGCWSLVE